MQVQFNDLLQGSSTDEGEDPTSDPNRGHDLTPGQMLLMGFNGLFTRLDADFTEMQEALGKLNIPDIWRKVDVVREARSMQV